MENRYLQYIQQGQKDKAGWLDPALSVLGAAGGFMVGGPAGAMAGYQMGHGAGNAAHDAVNGSTDPSAYLRDLGLMSTGWGALPAPTGYAEGGPVPGGQMPWWVRAGATQADPQAVLEQFGGPQVPEFKPQQPSHPTLEMLATIIPQVLASMPKPVKPNNRAIGTWLPAIGTAIGAPAAYAQGQREKANATGQARYDAQVEARNKRMAAAAPQVAAAMFRDPKEQPVNRLDQQVPATTLAGLGAPAWVKTWGDIQAWRDGQPKPTAGTGGFRGALGGEPTRMTDEAIRQHAVHFAMTGEYLNRGARDPVSADENRRISNMAAQLFPGRQMALVRAAYKGDAKSLGEMRVGRDGIHTFAQSAAKNLSMLRGVLSAVPDAGNEALNMPLREFEQRFRANPSMAAFNALRMSLNSEYARLTQAMKLSGMGIPVDSQREVRAAMGKYATVGNLLTAYQVMYEESNNRAEAMNDAINEISQRMMAPEAATQRPAIEGGER